MDAPSHKSESLSASRRCKSLNLRAFSPEECPSLPRSPRFSLPTLPLEGYKSISRILEVTPSLPPGVEDGSGGSEAATPHAKAARRPRSWPILDHPIFRRSQTAETLQTPLLPPPSIAIEEEGHSESLAPPMPPPSLACEEDGLLPPVRSCRFATDCVL